MLQRGAALAEVYKEKCCSLFKGKFWIGMQFTVLTIEESNTEESTSGRFPLEIAKSFSPFLCPMQLNSNRSALHSL